MTLTIETVRGLLLLCLVLVGFCGGLIVLAAFWEHVMTPRSRRGAFRHMAAVERNREQQRELAS